MILIRKEKIVIHFAACEETRGSFTMKKIEAMTIILTSIIFLTGCSSQVSENAKNDRVEVGSEAESSFESVLSFAGTVSSVAEETQSDTDIASSEESLTSEPDDMSIVIGQRKIKDYYYHDDAAQPLLVKKEKMLPIFNGGDNSVKIVQSDIEQMTKDLDRNTEEALKARKQAVESGDAESWQWLESLLSIITFDDRNYLNLRLISQRYEGGAHGSQMIYNYVFDKKEGKRLGLPDIINNDEKSFEELFIKHFREDGYAEESDESPEEITTERALKDYSFYITDNGLHIRFNRNEIGPTSMGNPDILIPYNELDMKISIDKGDQQYNAEDYYYDF